MSVFVYVSAFFAPAVPKRPPNFVVVKYFLLGLLISNSIESILIIPKILDVLDQSAIQAKALEEMDIKRAEVKELVAEKQTEEKDLQRERERELKVLLNEKGKSQNPNERENGENENENESEEEEEEAFSPQHHTKKGGQRGQKNHHSKGESGSASEKAREEAKSESEAISKEIRKRPQRLETGNNYVAVFMLFYGSSTLCLGVPAIFKESVRLLQALMVLSCVGTLILVSSKFSLIMIMSVVKDAIIAALTFYYIMMIQQSTPPGDQYATGPTTGGPVDASLAGAIPQAGDVNAFATDVTGVTVDYTQQQQLQSNVQQVYNPTAVSSGW